MQTDVLRPSSVKLVEASRLRLRSICKYRGRDHAPTIPESLGFGAIESEVRVKKQHMEMLGNKRITMATLLPEYGQER